MSKKEDVNNEIPWQLKVFISAILFFINPMGFMFGAVIYSCRSVIFLGEFENTNRLIFSVVCLFFMGISASTMYLTGFEVYFTKYFQLYSEIYSYILAWFISSIQFKGNITI